ncbi:hypothetical protein LV79_006110 [Actinokineospora globicatena]|nr:hypothetical protein [Actinokineospora globicatena]
MATAGPGDAGPAVVVRGQVGSLAEGDVGAPRVRGGHPHRYRLLADFPGIALA